MKTHYAGFPGFIYKVFTSTQVTLSLFALLICFLVPSTFSTELATVLLIPAKVILSLIGVELTICTLSRFKTLRRSTLLIHLGVLVILAGSLFRVLGFVATVNIYEGSSTQTVFSWDVKEDVQLDFSLRAAKIMIDYYPTGVKVGVLKNGRKAALLITRTGDSFIFEGYRVQVLSLNPWRKKIRLAVQSPAGKPIGTVSTSGRTDLPPDFPLDFKLVAFKKPAVKKMMVQLEILKNGKVITAGPSEVNRPLKWRGMRFFLTQVTSDNTGKVYAGIQISKDPGIPYVYGGFVILALGLLLSLKRWATVVRK